MSNIRRFRFLIYLPIFAALTGILVGCAHKKQKAPPPPSIHQAIRAPETISNKRMLTLLWQQHVTVIQQGARLWIMIPINDFFQEQSTTLKPYKLKAVNLIAIYLKRYTHRFARPVPIRVSGYMSDVFPRKERFRLSRQYAEVIASYLWDKGFSRKQLRIVGYGSLDPIASSKTPKGSSYNRRVMIEI